MEKHILNIVVIVFGAFILLGLIAALYPNPSTDRANREHEELAETIRRANEKLDDEAKCLKRSEELWNQGRQKESVQMRCQ